MLREKKKKDEVSGRRFCFEVIGSPVMWTALPLAIFRQSYLILTKHINFIYSNLISPILLDTDEAHQLYIL